MRRSGTVSVDSCSWWTALGARHPQAAPAGVAQAPGEVDLVGVDEEGGVEVVDLRGGLAPDEQRGGLAPVDLAGARAAALDDEPAVQEERAGERGERRRKAPGGGLGRAVGAAQRGAGAGGVGMGLECRVQREHRPGPQLGVLVEQQRVAPVCAAQQLGVVEALPAPLLDGENLVDAGVLACGLRGAVARAVVEHEHLARERQRGALARDRVEAAQQELALGGVDDAEAQLDVLAHGPIVSGDARPRRRPLGLHPPVRSRALPRAGGGGRGGGAVHEPLRLRRGGARGGLRAARALLSAGPPGRGRRAALTFAPGAEGGGARAGHAALSARGACGGHRALPVADRAAARRAPAPASAARRDRRAAEAGADRA